jgi:plastocyanin
VIRFGTVSLVLVAAIAPGCSNGSGTNSDKAPPPAAAAAAPVGPAVTGTAPSGAVVTLEPTTAQEFSLPEGPAIMDQYGKQFVPELLLVRVGQPVEFRNSEAEPHNVNVNRLPTGTAVFNVATAPYQKYVHTFEHPGQYAVACDIHPGMLATVVASHTPYVGVVGEPGTFEFKDLPAGEYTLRWSLNGKSGEKTVTVTSVPVTVAVP